MRRLRTSAVFALAFGLGGCSRSDAPPPFDTASALPALTFLDPQGPVAAAQRGHFVLVILIVLVVVLPVLVLGPYFAWRYRYNGAARYTPRWSFSWPLEVAIWGVPLAIVAVLSIGLWVYTHALDPYAPLPSPHPPLRVEVVGYDWKWLFIYPDLRVASIGEFAFPADRPLAIDLTSYTVMQSFFIPALGSQIYAMAGMVTHLHLMADAPGSFRGENTQYNGRGFHQQKFTARAMTPADFRAWVGRVRATGIELTDEVRAAIRQRSTLSETRAALGLAGVGGGPLHFTDVPADLFETIVGSFNAGMPGMAMSGRGTGMAVESPLAAPALGSPP